MNIKTKVLFIYGPLNAGGAERVLLDYLQNLDRDTYDISLCLIVDGGTLLHEVPVDIQTFSLFQSYNWYYKLAYRISIWFGLDFLFKRILKQKINRNYDVIISFLEGMPLKMHSLMDLKAKNYTWVHADLDLHRYTQANFYNGDELAAYKKMDKIILVSKNAENSFLKRFPSLKKKTVVVFNPIHIKKVCSLVSELEFNNDKIFKIVSVGRLTAPKQIDRLLHVAQKFIKSVVSLKFYIIGDGELRIDLEKLAKELQVEHLVTFLGYQANPYPYIKSADILVSTSSYEGFGLVLCEAMALGVPVVSTKTAGPMEIIGANEFGLLCDHNVEAIYEAIKQLVENKALREHYIQKGQERVKDFSLEKAVQQFDNLINNN
jgi:glycosyltransferase involved in cell wall biosynthesis